jgi:hypothetical protein
MNLSKTTKSISLVLISSALVFAGWGTPGCLSDAHDKDGRADSGWRRSGYGGGGRRFFWFTNPGSYGGTASSGSTGAASGSHGSGGSNRSGSTSTRGGFGSSASGVSA